MKQYVIVFMEESDTDIFGPYESRGQAEADLIACRDRVYGAERAFIREIEPLAPWALRCGLIR